MMTDDEIIAVVHAHKEGKKIEINLGMGWLDLKECMQEHYPNFQTGSFRVAPEPPKPREWEVFITLTDGISDRCPLNAETKYEKVRVREVLE